MTQPSTALPRILSADLPTQPPGSRVRIQGWLHRRRDLSRVSFLVVRDRSGLTQVVLEPDRAAALSAAEESVLEVTGTLSANPAAPAGVELVDPQVVVLAEPEQPPAFELWRPQLTASLPVQLDHPALAWRHPAKRALWQLAATAMAGFREGLTDQGFTEIATPKIVSTATESGADVFGLDYFGSPAYLAQSPQFYKQQLVGVFERVFEVGPVFRAEPSDTVRHLAEYHSLDAELGFITDHREVLAVLVEVLRVMVERVQHSPAADLVELTPVRLPEQVPVLHFAEALRLVGADPDEPDLAPEHERALGAWALAEHDSDFVAIEGYPMRKRPFYTHPQPDDPRWSNSFDLLFRGLELVTGGQRLHRHQDYVEAIRARGEDPEDYASYLAAFATGMPPHGGFAIGLERFTARLAGVENIRQVRLYPRDLHRVSP